MTVEPQTKEELTVANLSYGQRRKLHTLSRAQEKGAAVNVLNLLATRTTIAVRFPGYFWLWHLVKTSLYLPTRYLRFRARKWELYLLDWCYVES